MDLTTRYLGLTLQNPFVAGASPLGQDLETMAALEKAGIAAIVLPSLFEEQVAIEERELSQALSQGTESYSESIDFFPDLGDFKFSAEQYLEHLRQAKKTVAIPVIASLNGVSSGGWLRYAREMESAGADALELNIYYLPTRLEMTGVEVEKKYLDLVQTVVKQVEIPVALKLHPYLSSLPNLAKALSDAGAKGLVLFNRFYQPDLDIEKLEVVPALRLSTSDELRLRLRWIAVLFDRVSADLAVTGGVHTPADAVKSLMAGARAIQLVSTLLKGGIPHLKELVQGLQDWMAVHEYDSVKEMQGSLSQKTAADPDAFERANYMKVLRSYGNLASPNQP